MVCRTNLREYVANNRAIVSGGKFPVICTNTTFFLESLRCHIPEIVLAYFLNIKYLPTSIQTLPARPEGLIRDHDYGGDLLAEFSFAISRSNVVQQC